MQTHLQEHTHKSWEIGETGDKSCLGKGHRNKQNAETVLESHIDTFWGPTFSNFSHKNPDCEEKTPDLL